MIKFSNAVANPWTMMVHPLNAFLANSAMVKPLFLHKVALKAVADLIQ